MRRFSSLEPFDPLLPVFRRRTGWLLLTLAPADRALVRLLPLLLRARFRRPGFDRDAPGVLRPASRQRWGRLCERVDFPLPVGMTTARPLVRSVLLSAGGDGTARLRLFTVGELTGAERDRLSARFDVIESFFVRRSPRLTLSIEAAPCALSELAWAGVLCGELPPVVEEPIDRERIFASAPTPLTRALSLLLPPTPGDPRGVLTQRGLSAPVDFVAAWAGNARAATALRTLQGVDTGAVELFEASGALQRELVRAVRQLPCSRRRAIAGFTRAHLLGSRVLPAFRAIFDEALSGLTAREVEDGRGWAVMAGPLEIARGARLDDARAHAITESPRLARPGTEWRRLAALPRDGARQCLVQVEPPALTHLVVTSSPSGRFHARRVDADRLLRVALGARSRGATLEIIAAPGADQRVLSRLNQVAALPATDLPLGVQQGDRLLCSIGGRVRSRPLTIALGRPSVIRWLPEHADRLAALRPPTAGFVPSVRASAFNLGADRVEIVYVDEGGRVLIEHADASQLEAVLREAREVVRAAVGAALSVTVSPTLAALAGRGAAQPQPQVLFDVDSDGPFTTRLWLDGEAYAGPGDLPWSAAAETAFSRWPAGTTGRVGISSVRFIDRGPRHSGLDALAVRARVLRRLSASLARIAAVLRAA
jgi:hypothetical protein